MSASSGPVVAITPIVGASGNGLAIQANLETPSLPPGFPSELTAEMAWSGPDFRDKSGYTITVNDAEKAELRAAVEHYKCK
jgi:hypothetical protein